MRPARQFERLWRGARVSYAGPRVAARSMQEPSALIISLVGDLDVASAEDVEVALRSAVAASNRVVLDLRGATFADSSIFGTILRAYSRAGRRGFAVVLAPRGRVARLFTLMDAYSVVPTFASPRQAAEWCYLGARAPATVPDRGSLGRSR